MNEIIDKFLLLICCITLYLFQTDNSFVIIPVIIVIILSSLFTYYDDERFKLAGNLSFAILCFFIPGYIIFLPLLLYDIFRTKYQYVVISVPALLFVNWIQYPAFMISLTVLFTVVAYLLKYRTYSLKCLKTEYNELRDSTSEISLLLEEKNSSILKNQDYEINLATLNERNRISKEIHDNIGHLLSRALLQVGALLTIAKDETSKVGLTSLKTSLSDGMDQIRNSIHHMYSESIDLYSQIDNLVKDFTFCHISFEYDIKSTPPIALKHSLIAIIKESLVNIIRHSSATKVSILLREHPALFQLIIQDNGTMTETQREKMLTAFDHQEYGESMGLRNISDRVKGFGGNINISLDKGFQLFISIPKKMEDNQ